MTCTIAQHIYVSVPIRALRWSAKSFFRGIVDRRKIVESMTCLVDTSMLECLSCFFWHEVASTRGIILVLAHA